MQTLCPHTGVTPSDARQPGGVNWGVVGRLTSTPVAEKSVDTQGRSLTCEAETAGPCNLSSHAQPPIGHGDTETELSSLESEFGNLSLLGRVRFSLGVTAGETAQFCDVAGYGARPRTVKYRDRFCCQNSKSQAAAAGETPAVTPIYRERRQQNSPVASIARMRVCRDYHRPGACSRTLSPATTESPRSVRGRHVGGVGANRNRTNLAPGHGAAGDPQTGFMLCPLETPRRRHFPYQPYPTSRSRRHAAAHSLRAWLGHYNWLGTLFQDRVSA